MKVVLIATRNQIEAELKDAKAFYNSFPKMDNGLTADNDKTEEWKTAKMSVDRLFRALQDINSKIVRMK